MNLGDVFGEMPDRPDHPDFWKLSEIILGMDATSQAVGKDAPSVELDKLGFHEPSAVYMASQRGAMAADELAKRAPFSRQELWAMLIAVWVEGFIVGKRASS